MANGGQTAAAELVRIKSRPRSAVMLPQHQHNHRSGDEQQLRSNSSTALDLCYSASSDDEVQSLVGGAEDSPLPLEFRTSPPEGAHRPTRSLSPPPKLFLTDHHQHDNSSSSSLSSLSSLSTLRSSGPGTAAFNAAANQQQHGEISSVALAVANGNAVGSPRKRHRHTHHRSHSHGHHHMKREMQRPCLDFEKMQQVSLFPYLSTPHFFLFFIFFQLCFFFMGLGC